MSFFLFSSNDNLAFIYIRFIDFFIKEFNINDIIFYVKLQKFIETYYKYKCFEDMINFNSKISLINSNKLNSNLNRTHNKETNFNKDIYKIVFKRIFKELYLAIFCFVFALINFFKSSI